MDWRRGTGKHLWRNLKCLSGRKSFEQMMNLVWVGLGNPLTRHKTAGNHNLKSLYSLVYFWNIFCCKRWLLITPHYIMGLGVCFVFLPFWEGTSKQDLELLWLWLFSLSLCWSLAVSASVSPLVPTEQRMLLHAENMKNIITLSTLLAFIKSLE